MSETKAVTGRGHWPADCLMCTALCWLPSQERSRFEIGFCSFSLNIATQSETHRAEPGCQLVPPRTFETRIHISSSNPEKDLLPHGGSHPWQPTRTT